MMENAKEEGFYWEGEIPENGVFNFSPPQTGTGITKANVILQWKRDESTVLGEQSIRFKLNVADK
ncbi:hypothetical protein [Paraliobacillus ryukyuensis]|uniref:hypothetical protein n=1 Tax=Paraliobacillus ryukyuensis TaxID=200904 RepID=UPI0011BE79A6|nr:hypothetical protein [Paraliobacillus ryukyuensis]